MMTVVVDVRSTLIAVHQGRLPPQEKVKYMSWRFERLKKKIRGSDAIKS
jgi:hypothetical protein